MKRRKIDFAEGRRLLKIDVPAGRLVRSGRSNARFAKRTACGLELAAGLSLEPDALRIPQTRDEQLRNASSFPNILN